MSISGIDSSSLYRNYSNNANAVNTSMQQLSSGYRINSAADDAAGLAISEKMRSQITSYQTQSSNMQNEINAAQTADGALASVHSVLNRMQELASQATNGTYSDSDRSILQQEFSQLQSQIDSVYQSTNFNGNSLLENTLNLSGLSIGTQDAASAALDGLSAAINAVSGQRADFGAQQNRAEYTADGLMNSMINTQAAESEIRDIDIAKAVMENTKSRILMQASIALIAQANQSAYGVLRFLR